MAVQRQNRSSGQVRTDFDNMHNKTKFLLRMLLILPLNRSEMRKIGFFDDFGLSAIVNGRKIDYKL
jgi:hypothetical protein